MDHAAHAEDADDDHRCVDGKVILHHRGSIPPHHLLCLLRRRALQQGQVRRDAQQVS